MTAQIDSAALWLADFYLLATILLAAAMAALVVLRQPVRRLAVAKSVLVAMLLLAALCAVPGWSVAHLLANKTAPAAQLASVSSSAPTTTTRDPANLQSDLLRTAQLSAEAGANGPRDTADVRWHTISWPAVFVFAYLAGSTIVLAWLATGAVAAARLLRAAQPAPVDLMHLLREVAGRAWSLPDLRVSKQIDVAVALGVRRPVVLLPSAWVASKPSDQLRSVLAHELAHVQNCDLRWLAFSRALLALLWAQPLYWLLRRRMRLDQEALADAAAAEVTSRQSYAEQLVAWARSVPAQPRMALHAAVGLWEGPSQLRRRIALLLDERLTLLRECPRGWRRASSALAVATALLLSFVSVEPGTHADTSDAPSTESVATESQQPADATADSRANLENGDLPGVQVGTITITGPVLREQVGALPEPNVLAGQVIDESDRPLSGVEVSLFRYQSPDARKQLASEQTDKDGRYRFVLTDLMRELFPDGKVPELFNLLPDSTQLMIVARASGRVTVRQSELAARIAGTGIVFRNVMGPAATFSGRVTGPDGKPVQGALVSIGGIGPPNWEGTFSVRTDADGRYEIADLAPYDRAEAQKQQQAVREEQLRFAKDKDITTQLWVGDVEYLISVEHPDFAVKQARCEQIPGTRDLQLDPAALITGRVVNSAGQPVASAKVWLVKSPLPPDELDPRGSPPRFDKAGNYLHYSATTTTDGEGRYRLASLPANSYDLWVESGPWQYPGLDRVAAVAGRTTQAPDLIVTKGGTIRVRLIDDATGEPLLLANDVEARFLLLTERDTNRRPVVSRPVADPTDGVFVLDAYPGEFRVTCDYVMRNRQLAWLSAIRGLDNMPEIKVVDGETVDIDLRVKKVELPENSPKLVQARVLVHNGEHQKAIELATAIVNENPKVAEAWMLRAEAREKLGQIPELIAEYEQLLKLDPPSPFNFIARNNLAFQLATTEDDKLRDGKRAVELAEEAMKLGDGRVPDLYDTLAAAYAETGDFERAAATLEDGFKKFPGAPFREHLELYKSRRPLREHPVQPAPGNPDSP